MFTSKRVLGALKNTWPLLGTLALIAGCADQAMHAKAPATATAPHAAPAPPAHPTITLFNGKDLTGWHYPNGPALDGLTEVPGDDKRYNVVNGLLTVHARTQQQRTLELRTVANFTGDFILTLEFRAGVRADSGIFLRGHQLQCRDYSTVGPYTKLTKYKPQDWNQIEITVKGPTALCTCNGEVLEAAFTVPAIGGIGLESDGGIMEYRNIRLKPIQ